MHGDAHLLAIRSVTGLPWLYARVSSLAPVRAAAEAQAAAIFGTDRARRVRLRGAYLALIAGLAAVVAAVAHRVVEPIRRVARCADAITAGETPPDLAGAAGRADEVGRLAAAMQNLATRIRRRIASMENAHRLAETGPS